MRISDWSSDVCSSDLCNRQRLVDYPNLWSYTRELYQVPGVADTVNLHHIKHPYYRSHKTVNPSGIVPKGPAIDYTAPHDRARLKAASLAAAPSLVPEPRAASTVHIERESCRERVCPCVELSVVDETIKEKIKTN